MLVIGAGYALGYLTEALLLALLGVTIVILVMLREMIDVLGYLGVQQREARSVARPCGVNSSIPMLNPGSNPSSNPKSDRGAAIQLGRAMRRSRRLRRDSQSQCVVNNRALVTGY